MQKLLLTFTLSSMLLFSTFVWAGNVSRSQFTTGIQDREPVDTVITLSTDQTQVTYFSELSDLQGYTVTHQWVYNDKIMFEKSFPVAGPRWRVWSTKTLHPGWSGTWTVKTLDQDRSELLSQSFEYQ